ncbi:type II secretion system protein N [Bowmanella dokdonensis]|uniref:Type II secretion system protein GspC N-terminal domain-containing protein n=1 Tax=Bowmanella dokdonensis TaxID=751969 RepID=A0A939DRV4_9ALTE|nr:type II secretion system protein N [Bowmanella dokdonensis]MBN7827645.1 hypothetical protein [Bowmanella dokdonensis]
MLSSVKTDRPYAMVQTVPASGSKYTKLLGFSLFIVMVVALSVVYIERNYAPSSKEGESQPLLQPLPTGDQTGSQPSPGPLANHTTAFNNLFLKGVLLSSDPELSIAIISMQQHQAQFTEGDKIGEFVLLSIQDDRVLLSNGIVEEWLVLTDSSSGQRSVEADPGPLQALFSSSALKVRIGLAPHRVNGEFVGMAVFPLGDSFSFMQTGLESGDVITAINGHSLTADFMKKKDVPTFVDGTELTILRHNGYLSVSVNPAR